MAKKQSKPKKIKMYKSVDEINAVERIRSASIDSPSIAENGGMSDFWSLIKAQGAALREDPPEIPRNHIWKSKGGKK